MGDTKESMQHPPDSGREALFELIVESVTDFAIFTIDPEGLVTIWNPGAQRMFGYEAEQIVGVSADRIFTPEDRASAVPDRERQDARRHGRAQDERWHQRQDGSRFWAAGLLMPLRPPAEGFVKITRDRTREHEAAERLRENEERFRLLATSIPQLVFRTRSDGYRTWGSPQWVDFTGLSMDASLGEGWMDAIHPDDRDATREAWTQAVERGEYYLEHRVRRAVDGEFRWHQTRARPVGLGDPRLQEWVGTMTDIHELRGLQDRQQLLLGELQHRTRNLLAVVQSIANQTLRKSGSLDEFQADFQDRLQALGRVQGLLALTDEGDVELAELVRAELAAHGHLAASPERVVVGGDDVLLPAGSAQALGLALHELATNALKHGALSQPRGRLEVSWRLTTDEHGLGRVEVEWRESGVAMPPRDQGSRRGYGTELIERALPYQLGAATHLEFGPDGVSCRIVAPIERQRREPGHG